MSSEPRETRPAATAQSGASPRPGSFEPDAPLISNWLQFLPDGTLEVYTGKVEIGQNIRTSLAQCVAEELCLPPDAIQMVMADTDRTPYDMGTVGSRTTPVMAARLRAVAASTRELLLDMAAERWNVPREQIRVDNGQIFHAPTQRSMALGELVGGKKLAHPYDLHAPTTPAEGWSIAGASLSKVDARLIVTGQRRYTPDLDRPGMQFGKVLRSPSIGATLVSLDSSAAEALPDVVVVHDGNFVGVVAPDRAQATRALAALHAEWQSSAQVAQAELFEHLRNTPAPPAEPGRFGGPQTLTEGSLAEGRAQAKHTLTQRYTNAYIAHAPMEPRAAVAEWNDGKLTVWTGTQRPFGVRTELAQAFELAEDQVRVIVPDTGGGFGGKHFGDAAVEAARLAKAASKPVKLIWTREEEFSWAYLRPAGVIEVASAVDDTGHIVAWEFHNYNSGAAGIRMPYTVAHQHIEYHPSVSPLRQGSYRALAATANNFARESHMDEIAHHLGVDPLQFRLDNLENERLRAVLEAAAEAFDWHAKPAPGHGIGIACGTEKGSYVATCAEVATGASLNDLKIMRVVVAFECGAIVNPNGLQNQVVGAVIQGLGGALYEAITFADGTITSDRFSRYRVPRFGDIPPIEVVLLDRKDLPSEGAGETPIIAIAPAISNAIFAATSTRLRSLPLLQESS